MAKKQLSLTIDSEIVDRIDQIAKERNQNRSECIERILEHALGDDGSGLVEFFRIKAPVDEIIHWMRTADVFKDKHKIPEGEDGLTELVLRVTRRQMKLYLKRDKGYV